MKRTVALALTAVLALPACGGGSDGGTGAAAFDGEYESAQEVYDAIIAADLTCDEYAQNKEVIGVKEEWSCYLAGERDEKADITIWNSSESRTQIREATAVFQSGFNVDGDRWSVNVPTKVLADQVAEKIGGEVS